MRDARSASLAIGLGAAIVVETVVLHLWIASRHPVAAWLLTASSVSVLVWLALDYRALGRGAVGVDGAALELAVGRRAHGRIARDAIAAATRPTWRELPVSGTPEAAGYVNLTKPAQPNVLITLATPVTLRLVGGVRRAVQRIALCLDEPDAFIAALRTGQ
ncbi:MAG: hypothetical protein HOQ09_01035 [Gemmatimonadaceae bacterium]|nr:hypothetical protein [Gemmatimonadaceae bacterium]